MSLILLGQLEPQKGGRKYPRGDRHEQKGFASLSARGFPSKSGVARPLQQQKSRNVTQRALPGSDEDDSLDEEDLRIAGLEKKLGMGKQKKSKVEDDGLDGTCRVFFS